MMGPYLDVATKQLLSSPACGGGLGWGCFGIGILRVERAPTRRALRARRPQSELRSSRPASGRGEASQPSQPKPIEL